MEPRIKLAIWCVLFFTLSGCDKKPANFPVSSGSWSVNSATGIAIGKDAFGIDFEVAGATLVESDLKVRGNLTYSSQAEITLADDLKIELVTTDDGGLIALQLNGTAFGNLKRGDKVVIDEERNVTVNGKARTTAESPTE